MLAGLGRSLLLAGGGITGGLGIVAVVYGPGDLADGVRSKLSLERPAVTAPEKPEWGEGNLDLGRALTSPDPQAARAPERETAPAPERQAGLPSLDIVRVEPSGDAVIAGRGAPNATVEILRDNKPFASGVVDETGQFAIVPPALPAGNSELTYRTIGADGKPVMGRENVVVVVPAKPDAKPLVAVGTPDKPTEVLSQPDAPAQQAAEAKKPEGAPAPGKPDVGRSEAAKPQPSPSERPPERIAALPDAATKPSGSDDKPKIVAEKKADLKIVSVDAQEGGRLDISGRATAWSTLRLYLNDTLVATGKTGPDGRIAFTIGRGVSPGGYQIRLDQVDPASGKVAHRAQVSFAFPDSPAARVASREDAAPQAGTKPVAPPPPPIPERPAASAPQSRPSELAGQAAAAPPRAEPGRQAQAGAQPNPTAPERRPVAELPPKPSEPAARAGTAPTRAAEAAAPAPVPTEPEIAGAPARASGPRPTATRADAPSGLTTTWVQPPAEPSRRPAAETPALAGTAKALASQPNPDSDRKAAQALAPELPPAARPEQQAASRPDLTPAPAARADAAASKPDQGLTIVPPASGSAMPDIGQPGAVFVPEISTAKITRGDSLWVISKRTYGRGLRYTVIFDANQDQIKDPDLIYPGQIFVLPKDSPLGGEGAKRG